MIFVVMALLILLIAVLWSVDIRRVVFTKDAVQAAGDSAALAAARWQGTSLNLIGELNDLHFIALVAGKTEAVDAITNAQARLCLVGPMTAFSAAQVAGKLNGLTNNAMYEAFLREHADAVRDYKRIDTDTGRMRFPEPYEGAWDEYAKMLEAVADAGVAVGADNAQFFTDGMDGHTLYDRSFYRAVASRWWCWFFPDDVEMLEGYTGYAWWPSLPEPSVPHYGNSEIFGLGLRPMEWTVYDDMTNRHDTVVYGYAPWAWGAWTAIHDPFPVVSRVRPEYDYAGADVVTRSERVMARLMPGTRQGDDAITWISAAKPLGYLEDSGSREVPMARDGIVFPAFRDVRLIPVDTASGAGRGAFDLAWRRHIDEHLPIYVERGPSACPQDCRYCRILATWEEPSFRAAGAGWLSTNSWKCTLNPPTGGRGGGSSYGH